MSKAKLIVRRDFASDAGFRPIHVFLDEKSLGVLAVTQSKEWEIEAGVHVLRVYNTLVSKSVDLALGEGEIATFRTGNMASGCLLAVFVSFGIPVMKVLLERVEAP